VKGHKGDNCTGASAIQGKAERARKASRRASGISGRLRGILPMCINT